MESARRRLSRRGPSPSVLGLRPALGRIGDYVAARIERHRFEAVEITTRIEQLRESISFLEKKADGVAAEKENEEQEISHLLNQLEQARQQADALSLELSEINRRAAAVRDSRGAIEVQRAEAQARALGRTRVFARRRLDHRRGNARLRIVGAFRCHSLKLY